MLGLRTSHENIIGADADQQIGSCSLELFVIGDIARQMGLAASWGKSAGDTEDHNLLARHELLQLHLSLRASFVEGNIRDDISDLGRHGWTEGGLACYTHKIGSESSFI